MKLYKVYFLAIILIPFAITLFVSIGFSFEDCHGC